MPIKPARQPVTTSDDFDQVFVGLRAILERYASSSGYTGTGGKAKFVLTSDTQKDRAGRPLFLASVEVKKRYVSYHLLPIYMNPALQAAIPAALKKRMQGKACFNFTQVDRSQFKELAELTQRGIASFKNVKLPWDKKG